MWYKCLNPNCGFIFKRTGKCNECPDCGKEYIGEANSDEIAFLISKINKTMQTDTK